MKRILYILPILFLLHSCKEALVLDIKTVSLPKTEKVYFGNNQEVIVNALPDSTLSISYNDIDSSFHWTINKPAYFKINDTTQNTLPLGSLNTIQVGNVSFDFKKLKPFADKFTAKDDRVKYIKLSNLIRAAYQTSSSTLDSLNTLIACDEEDNKLIILDKNVIAVKLDGSESSYQITGSKKANKISIKFFRTFNSILLDTSGNNELFHIGDTIFYTTVKPYFTPFGANEISIEAKANLEVSFNKFCRTVIPKEAIDTAFAKNNSIPVSLKQKTQSNTYSNEIYTTNISNSNLFELGIVDTSLNFIHSKANLLISQGNFASYIIDKKTYFLSGIPLCLVFLFGIIIILLITSKNDVHESELQHSESPRWKKYFLMIYTCLFALLLGRLMVGYNLAFAQPYFSFAFPTSIIVSPLILLSVLYSWLILLLNFNDVKISTVLRLVILLFTISLLSYLYWFTNLNNHIFISQFRESFTYNPFKASNNEIYYQTIYSLSIFISALSISFLFRISKAVFITCLIILGLSMVIQKSSYSVGNSVQRDHLIPF